MGGDTEPVRQGPLDLAADDRLADRREPGLGVGRLDQDLEARSPGIAIDVVASRGEPAAVDQLGDVEGQGGLRVGRRDIGRRIADDPGAPWWRVSPGAVERTGVEAPDPAGSPFAGAR